MKGIGTRGREGGKTKEGTNLLRQSESARNSLKSKEILLILRKNQI